MMESLYDRVLCSFIQDPAQRRHCENPLEENQPGDGSNVFFPSDNNKNPLEEDGDGDEDTNSNDGGSPLGSDEKCVSDEDGNYNPPNSSSSSSSSSPTSLAEYDQIVEYQYEVQTTLDMSASELTGEALRKLEKTLSDLLVADLFKGFSCETTTSTVVTEVQDNKDDFAAVGEESDGSDGGITSEGGGKASMDLTGLSAKPGDELAPGVQAGT